MLLHSDMGDIMKNVKVFAVILIITSMTFNVSCIRQEPHVKTIITKIVHTKNDIEEYVQRQYPENNVHPIFVSFWDFDGTILKGDCSEGYEENSTPVYKGLVQIAIEYNYSTLYKPNKTKKFFDYYTHLEKTMGHLAAYTYLTTIFAGQKRQSLIALSTHYFNTTLQHYYFASSLLIMKELIKNNIGIYIISASPEFFVKGASQSLAIHPDNIYGIELLTRNGILTATVKKPITYAEGKTAKVQEILTRLQQLYSTQHVYAIAAFGNSYHTDGPFLQYVATHRLPIGTPTAVMINGGLPPAVYEGMFTCVQQHSIIGDSK